MSPDKACAVVLSSTAGARILLFRHPLAGAQLVKGTIEEGETPSQAALRELSEESGIDAATVVGDLGVWDAEHLDQIWSFHLCQAKEPLPERWSHQTLDDHGHLFQFFWASLDQLPHADCHPVFSRALGFLSIRLQECGYWMPESATRNDQAVRGT